MSPQEIVVVARLLYNQETCYLKEPEFPITRGDLVVIETNNGPEIAGVSGTVAGASREGGLGTVIRKCTEKDLQKQEENLRKEEEAFSIAVEKINKHRLDMKLVNTHFFLDNSKIIFNFTADGRVDFRELVKDLASVFKKRIELRQIGARDEARIIAGYGVCGREFCCNSIKHELQPVTIRMAKDQNLTLNSTKISGACGRLLCCLAYEHEAYCTVKKCYPHEGSVLHYNGKTVTLTELNVLKHTATLRSEDRSTLVVPLEELAKATRRQKKEKEQGAPGKEKTASRNAASAVKKG